MPDGSCPRSSTPTAEAAPGSGPADPVGWGFISAVARRRDRSPDRHVCQPVLRQGERPHAGAVSACGVPGWSLAWWVALSGSSWSRWRPTSRSFWWDGASPRCSSTRCSQPWWRCCRTRSRSPQRGQVSGILGVCLPIASVSGTFVVQLFTGNELAMFLATCAIGGFFILLFAARLEDRRLAIERRPSLSPLPCSEAASLTAPAVGRHSSARRRSCSDWRCSPSPWRAHSTAS